MTTKFRTPMRTRPRFDPTVIDLLQVNGWTERIGDWQFASHLQGAVVERACVEDANSNGVTLVDILASRNLAAYSLGVASLWAITDGWKAIPSGQTYNLVVLVAGCLDWLKGQFNGWHAPKCAQRCYCFQVTPAVSFPVSNPLIGELWFDISDPNLKAQLRANPCANINCDTLASGIGGTPITVHRSIQNHPQVLELMEWMYDQFGGAV